jgi:hypothetical protein
VGQVLKVSMGNKVYEGKLLGINEEAVFVVSADEAVNPWKLQTTDEILNFYPEALGVRVEVL